jgi:hypothetical protein
MLDQFDKFPPPNGGTKIYADGSIVLEYYTKEARALIMTDILRDEDTDDVVGVGLYVSYVSKDEMWVKPVTDDKQVADLLRKMGLVAE